MLRRAWRDDILELVQTGRGLAIERAELERIKVECRCRKKGCDNLTLGKSGYCEDHRGGGNRGKSIADGTRAPTSQYRISDAERERRRAAMRGVTEKVRTDPTAHQAVLERRQATRRQKINGAKATAGEVVLETADVVQLTLPAVTAGRSASTVNEHAQKGLLVPADVPLPPLPGRPPNLFYVPAVDEYLAWLTTHPDGRLRRFDDPRFRSAWHCAAHHDPSLYGRLAKMIAEQEGKPVGRAASGDYQPPSPEQEKQIRWLAPLGRPEREIAERVGCSRHDVRKVLGR
jgi:hypothetical protein